jgi:hypothetical protein
VRVSVAFAAAGFVLLVPRPGLAVDGVVEINQAVVDAAGGYPYAIKSSGSYRLTGNLDLKAAGAGPNVTAIEVKPAATEVTIDLNGFAILGPAVCSPAFPARPTSCTNKGTGDGILVDEPGSVATTVRVFNGTISGMGEYAINSANGRLFVQSLHVLGNALGGVYGGGECMVADIELAKRSRPSPRFAWTSADVP